MTTDRAERQRRHETEYDGMTQTCNELIIKRNKLAICFVADMVCGRYGFSMWPIWFSVVADIIRYRCELAADMVAPQHNCTLILTISKCCLLTKTTRVILGYERQQTVIHTT